MDLLHIEPNMIQNENWLIFTERLSKFSKSFRSNNVKLIDKHLIEIIHAVLCFSKQNDINMMLSWNRWLIKSNQKNYD